MVLDETNLFMDFLLKATTSASDETELAVAFNEESKQSLESLERHQVAMNALTSKYEGMFRRMLGLITELGINTDSAILEELIDGLEWEQWEINEAMSTIAKDTTDTVTSLKEQLTSVDFHLQNAESSLTLVYKSVPDIQLGLKKLG